MRKQALISVSDKTGVVDFAKGLVAAGYHILSTGGTAKLLAEQGVPCQEVADYTGFRKCSTVASRRSIRTFTPAFLLVVPCLNT